MHSGLSLHERVGSLFQTTGNCIRFIWTAVGGLKKTPDPFLVIALTIFIFPASSHAGDWPQILGPHRSGVADSERLLDAWPEKGPAVVWERPVGQGFAGVAAAGGKVILFHRQADQEVAECLDAATGKAVWRHAHSTSYVASISDDAGPRSVPTITKDKVVLYGVQGMLVCLRLSDGKELWSRDTHGDFEAQEGFFGAGSTPLVGELSDGGDSVYVNVGGRKGSGVVAFNLADGKTRWQATDESASYSSPIIVTYQGTKHLAVVTRLQFVSLDPATGKERFRFPFGKVGPTVNGATPLACDDGRIFLSASYNIGCVMFRLGTDRHERLWSDLEAMASQYSTCIYREGHLYGVDGRADLGSTELRCLSAKNGKIVWSEKDFGVANLIHADGKLIAIKDDGTLVLAKISPERYQQLASAKILTHTTRALPALANGVLYVRDAKTLKAVRLAR